MSKKTYCIAEVWDYKGGELNMKINLSYNNFIQELANKFEGLDVSDEFTINDIKEAIEERLKDDDFYSTYGGGDGFCGELYEITNNKMKEVNFNDFIEDISKQVFKWYNS